MSLSLPTGRIITTPPWARDPLWLAAGRVPVLDLRLDRGSLTDVVRGIIAGFTRPTSSKPVWDGSQFVNVGADQPGFHIDPISGLRGLLHDPQATNLFLNSETPATQSITVTAQQYTLSFYGTGTVTLSGASTAGPLVGSGVLPVRSQLTFTPSAGSLTLTLSGSVLRPQLETGPIATSYIATGGSPVVRAADALVFSGSNFSSWFPSGDYTIAIEVVPLAVGLQQFFYSLDNSASAVGFDEVRGFMSGANVRTAASAVNNVLQVSYFGQGNVAVNQAERWIHAFSLNNSTIAGNRFARPATDTSCTLPPGLDRLRFGARGNGTFASHALLRRLQVFAGRLSDANLDAMAAASI